VVTSCIALSTPFNIFFGWVWFGEKLSKRMIIGVSVVFTGVIWLALSRGKVREGQSENAEIRDLYKFYAISIACLLGLMNALRTAHGKYI
jgi:drug/metabolite transporter (DMT)-like permease